MTLPRWQLNGIHFCRSNLCVLTMSIHRDRLPHMKVVHTIDEIDFEWDSTKAEANVEKHNIKFIEAAEVFLDPFVQVVDAQEVDSEAREAVVGQSRKWRLLYVAFVWRKLALRIISARKATKPEQKNYEDR